MTPSQQQALLRCMAEALEPFRDIAILADAYRHEPESTCMWRITNKALHDALIAHDSFMATMKAEQQGER